MNPLSASQSTVCGLAWKRYSRQTPLRDVAPALNGRASLAGVRPCRTGAASFMVARALGQWRAHPVKRIMISWFAAGLKHPASARSSRSGEATWAVRGAAPFRSAVFARFVQAAPHTVGVEVLGVDRRTRLLPPGLVQTAGIDAIKAQFPDELQNEGLGCVVVARNGQGDAPGRACRPAQFEKMSGVNVVERFDHRPANLLLDPAALRQARLDRLDAAVALARVIVAGIDYNHPVRRIGEQTGREVRNILLRNGNHDET